jgi:anti-anti-sigma regulatory factor
MKLYLIPTRGKHKGVPIAIQVDLYMIGTVKACQMRAKRPGVGEQHCCIVTRDRKKVFVRDLNSGGTTLVNGELVPPGVEWPLHAGDKLAVGPLEFLVQFREKELSQRDHEEWALKCLDEDSRKGVLHEIDEDDIFRHEQGPSSTAALAASTIFDKLQARRGVVKGRLRVGFESGVTIIRFNDVYLVDEAELALVRKELYDNLTRPNLRVLLDFKNVRRMSSNAVEMVLELHRFLRRAGCTLVLCRIRPELRGILETLHVYASLKHFADKRDALTASW